MAKSKNSTNKNQISKAHRNGIHRPRPQKYASLKGVI
jgi:large subunit ribosomal protein L29e